MIVDSSHKKWITVTLILVLLAVGLYLWLDARTPGGLTGGSTVGLWYGVIGTLLMIYAGLLSALRKVPSWWWIGVRKVWLKGHIWLGLLSGVVIWCHSGFRWGGPLEIALWAVLLATLFTGVFGLLLQQVLPRMLTTRVLREAPFENLPHLCQVLRGKADATLLAVWQVALPDAQESVMASQAGINAKVKLQKFYDEEVRPFLAEQMPRQSGLAKPLRAAAMFAHFRALPGLLNVKDQLNLLESLCEERRQYAEQERLHRWLHGWMLLHIPLSVALLVLGAVHIYTALYY